MTSRRRGRIAWIAPALAAAAVIGHQLAYPGGNLAEWTFGVGFVSYAAVGGLIADRYPHNPVGWMFCVIGVAFSTGDFVSDFAVHEPGPAATVLAVLNTASGPGTLVIFVLALMLFPNGHFATPRWRRAALALIAANVVLAVVLTLEPGPLADTPTVVNPIGLDAAAGLLHTLADVGGLVIAATALTAIAAVVARFRASRGLERQQLKWLAFSAAAGLAVLAGLLVANQFVNLDTGAGQVVAGVMLGLVVAAPPVAAAVAMLRYRLYDIDVVINRALVYGALTATLAVTYLGGVVLIGLAVGESGFAVAASTLAVAALFRPARARIQEAVDRRFYRRRYDAAQTLAGFGARLRDQVELDALSRELRSVIHETVQPAHVSLWLRRR